MKIVVHEGFDGRTVKDLLMHMGLSRATVTRLKKLPDGITLNGNHVTVRGVLKKDDIINLRTEDTASDENEYLIPEKMNIDIIYEDEDVIAVNKPPHMPTHTSMGHPTGTLANGVAYYFSTKGIPFVFRAINRLDRDTSGVVLLAKNRISAAKLGGLLKSGKIKKRYFAVLNGKLKVPAGIISKPIRRKPGSVMLREICSGEDIGAKLAVTEYKTVGIGDGLSAVEAKPITGRTHQLRVHFGGEGAPIVGDGLYGTADKNPTEYDRIMDRQALHALSLDIDFSDKVLSLYAPIPEDMARLTEDMDISEFNK